MSAYIQYKIFIRNILEIRINGDNNMTKDYDSIFKNQEEQINLLNQQTAYMNMIRFVQKQIIKIKNSVNKLEKQKEELSKPDLKIAK